MSDPYRYPGTGVVRNKEDIRDKDELDELERRATLDRITTLPNHLPITADGYREIHRYPFRISMIGPARIGRSISPVTAPFS